MSVYTTCQVRNIRLVFVDSRIMSVYTTCQVRDIRLVFCDIACVIRYLFLERCIQTYGNGRCIIVATYGHGGFTGCAEEFDIVVFVFSEVNSFRIGSVGDTEFCGNIGNCRIAVIDISYQLSIIHTILDSRAVSLNGKSLICFHIKGDSIIRIVNRFTVLLRAFVRGRFEYPAFGDIVRIGRDFGFQRLQLEYVDRVIVIGAACHIGDTTIILLNLFIADRIFFISYRYYTIFFLEGFLG